MLPHLQHCNSIAAICDIAVGMPDGSAAARCDHAHAAADTNAHSGKKQTRQLVGSMPASRAGACDPLINTAAAMCVRWGIDILER